MKAMVAGVKGYARLERGNASVRVTDLAITVVGTLLAAVTWALWMR